MIHTSDKFHEAIRNDEPQMPFFLFGNAVMMAQDIDIQAGMQFVESAMVDGDYVPGSCCSSMLSFTLMNETGCWSGFDFGDFTAYLGARTYYNVYRRRDSNCRMQIDSTTLEGWSVAPYLRKNGAGVSGVTEPILALLLVEEKLFAFSAHNCYQFEYNSGNITAKTHDFYMAPVLKNSEVWKRQGWSICYGHNVPGVTTGLTEKNNLVVSGRTVTEAYEMIPLGVFIGETPTFNSKKSVFVQVNDAVIKLDDPCPEFTYPTSVVGLLDQICSHIGVTLTTRNLTNGDLVIPTAPDLSNNTMRDVVEYIGQVTGSFCRMNRYGEMTMSWFTPSGMQLDGHDYSECDEGYYNVAEISQVVVRDASADDVTAGSGNNIFYINQNPIVKAIMTGGG